jgi:lysophospholipase L1-like esterase
MSRRGRWLALVAGTIAICATWGCQKPGPAPSTAPSQFLALGDSYTIGESVDASERWPVQLAQRLRDTDQIDLGEPKIIAHTGWTSGDLGFAVDVEDPKGPFQLVTLLIGVNNQFRHASIDEFRTQFADLLRRAIGFAGDDPKHVIVLSIPDWGQTPYARNDDPERIGREIDQFNAVCKSECEKKNVKFIDITPISRHAASDPSLVAPDGLHPSGKMYREWVQQMLPAVKAALTPPEKKQPE